MKRLLASVAIVAMLAFQVEQAMASNPQCLAHTEAPTSCNNTEGSSTIHRAATDPIFATVPFPLTAGQSGIWQLWLDPGSAFANANPNYPTEQNAVPGFTPLAVLDLQPGLPRDVLNNLTSPIPFDTADSLVVDMLCNVVGVPAFPAAEWWAICWITKD